MTIEDIKQAINDGHLVELYDGTYEVIKDTFGQFLIHSKYTNHYVGLHGMVGTEYEAVTNYPIADFYVVN